MALEDASKQSRDKLLDDLKTANDELYKKAMKAIDVEEELYRNIFKARGGAQVLAKANAATSKLLLINDINTFLTG